MSDKIHLFQVITKQQKKQKIILQKDINYPASDADVIVTRCEAYVTNS